MEPKRSKLERLLSIKFAKEADVLVPPIETNPESLVLSSNLNKYEDLVQDRVLYIKEMKKKLLERTNRRDPIHILLIEKLAAVMYDIEYLTNKFPNEVVIVGTKPTANSFIMELEYIKALLYNQLSFLADSLSFSDEEVDEIFIFTKQGDAVSIQPESTKEEKEDGTSTESEETVPS